jgi:hypothetical protein
MNWNAVIWRLFVRSVSSQWLGGYKINIIALRQWEGGLRRLRRHWITHRVDIISSIIVEINLNMWCKMLRWRWETWIKSWKRQYFSHLIQTQTGKNNDSEIIL